MSEAAEVAAAARSAAAQSVPAAPAAAAAAVAHRGELAACAKFPRLTNDRQDLTNCRAAVPDDHRLPIGPVMASAGARPHPVALALND